MTLYEESDVLSSNVNRGLDERRFVITEVMTYIELFHGSPMLTFHGTAEWALDYILQTEAVWIPSETQLRKMVARHGSALSLQQEPDAYSLSLDYGSERLNFTAADACDAYGAALLQLMWREVADPDTN